MEFNRIIATADVIFDMAGDIFIIVFIQYKGAVPGLQTSGWFRSPAEEEVVSVSRTEHFPDLGEQTARPDLHWGHLNCRFERNTSAEITLDAR